VEDLNYRKYNYEIKSDIIFCEYSNKFFN